MIGPVDAGRGGSGGHPAGHPEFVGVSLATTRARYSYARASDIAFSMLCGLCNSTSIFSGFIKPTV